LSQLRRALTPHGTLVIVGGETGGRWLEGADRLLRAPLLPSLVSQKLSTLITSENSKDLMVLRVLLESGKVAPAIDRTYPLSSVPAAIRYAAIRYVQEGHARGKVVITV
jgi:NADPH:quinone reductase-like Zn-dependent oxidoreductase